MCLKIALLSLMYHVTTRDQLLIDADAYAQIASDQDALPRIRAEREKLRRKQEKAARRARVSWLAMVFTDYLMCDDLKHDQEAIHEGGEHSCLLTLKQRLADSNLPRLEDYSYFPLDTLLQAKKAGRTGDDPRSIIFHALAAALQQGDMRWEVFHQILSKKRLNK